MESRTAPAPRRNWIVAVVLFGLPTLAVGAAFFFPLHALAPRLHTDEEAARIAARFEVPGNPNVLRPVRFSSSEPRHLVFKRLGIDPTRLLGPAISHNHLLIVESWQLSPNYIVILSGSALQPEETFLDAVVGKGSLDNQKSLWTRLRDWFSGFVFSGFVFSSRMPAGAGFLLTNHSS